MRMKRLAILSLVFSLLFAATVYAADEAYDWYKGKKIKVMVNGTELRAKSLNIEGTSMVSLREIAIATQSIVTWDEDAQAASIVKPSVHIAVMLVDQKGNKPFGMVTTKESHDLAILTQVDSLKSKIDGVRLTIEDPTGEIVFKEEENNALSKDFWYTAKASNFYFKRTGTYTVNFYMKVNNEYFLVSQKEIESLSK